VDLDLVQALFQTRQLLDRRDGSDGGRFDELGRSVDAVLSLYRIDRSDEVAYPEEGADLIDRTLPDAPEQQRQVQAALIAFAERPTPDNAAQARHALDELHGTLTG
jgi:hypothetical protein